MTVKKGCFIFFLLLLSSRSWGLSKPNNKEKVRFMESVSETLKENRIFFHWSKSGKIGSMIKNYLYSKPKIFKKYFAKDKLHLSVRERMGLGLYVSSDPVDSRFYGGKSGTLQIVKVNKGQRILDLTRKDIVKKLSSLGVDKRDVAHLTPDVIVKYESPNNSWYVIKFQGKNAFSIRMATVDDLNYNQVFRLGHYYKKYKDFKKDNPYKFISKIVTIKIKNWKKTLPSLSKIEGPFWGPFGKCLLWKGNKESFIPVEKCQKIEPLKIIKRGQFDNEWVITESKQWGMVEGLIIKSQNTKMIPLQGIFDINK